jgi:hypothetical protein
VKHTLYLAILGTALALGAGCGGGDSSPSDKCTTLIDDLCNRATSCVAGAAGMQAQCVQAVEANVACSAVKSVTESYDGCIDTINSQSCSTLFPSDPSGQVQLTLPDNCRGVLQTSTGAPRLAEAFTAAIRATR